MSHHFDTPTAREDSRINVCELYLFQGRPGFTVMAMTVKPDAHHPRQIYFVKKACTHSSSTSTAEPTKGMFIWARLPHIAGSFTLAESARSEGSVLAPGVVFRPHPERALDAIQRCDLRRPSHRALARTTIS